MAAATGQLEPVSAADTTPSPNGRHRRWSFTSFAELLPADQLSLLYKPADDAPPVFSFLVAQKELCPSTGRPHWQCYVEFPNEQRFSRISALLVGKSKSYHAKVSLGTPEQNITYCTKVETRSPDSTIIQLGTPMNTRAGRPVAKKFVPEDVIGMMLDGAQLEDCLRALGPQLLVPGAIQAARQAHQLLAPHETRSKPLHVEYHWGAPGVGKTTAIRRIVEHHFGPFSEKAFVYSQSMGPWFDGYQGQVVLIFDDCGKVRERASRDFVAADYLRFLDKTALMAPIKGGAVAARWTHVFIVSNLSPEEWVADAGGSADALLDRITHRIEYEGRVSFRAQDRLEATPPLHTLTVALKDAPQPPSIEAPSPVHPRVPNDDDDEDWMNL